MKTKIRRNLGTVDASDFALLLFVSFPLVLGYKWGLRQLDVVDRIGSVKISKQIKEKLASRRGQRYPPLRYLVDISIPLEGTF